MVIIILITITIIIRITIIIELTIIIIIIIAVIIIITIIAIIKFDHLNQMVSVRMKKIDFSQPFNLINFIVTINTAITTEYVFIIGLIIVVKVITIGFVR